MSKDKIDYERLTDMVVEKLADKLSFWINQEDLEDLAKDEMFNIKYDEEKGFERLSASKILEKIEKNKSNTGLAVVEDKLIRMNIDHCKDDEFRKELRKYIDYVLSIIGRMKRK